MTTLNIFLASLFLTIVFVLIKVWEQKKQRKMFLSKFLARGDTHLFKVKVAAEDSFHDNKHRTIFFFLVHLPERIELFFARLKKRAHDKYRQMSVKMRGKQTLDHGGDVSPFMRNLGSKDDKR